MVVSSVTPLMPGATVRPALRVLARACCASSVEDDAVLLGVGSASASGTAPAVSNSAPLWTSSVASPPSSRIMFGPVAVGPRRAPARCTTSTPRASRPSRRRPGRPAGPRPCRSGPTATAAAAWSCVEKMLQRHPAHLGAERGRASRSARRSGSVMCSEPDDAARPSSGCCAAVLARAAPSGRASRARRGWISLRPNSASERSATLKSVGARTGRSSCVRSPSVVGVVQRSRRLVLLLLAAQPVGGGDVLRALAARPRASASTASRSSASLRIRLAKPTSERPSSSRSSSSRSVRRRCSSAGP